MNPYEIKKEQEHREIILSDYIKNSTVKDIIERILDLNYKDDQRELEFKDYKRPVIKLYINSLGGSVYDGLSLFDVIENSKTEIHTISTGSSMSMGVIIILAGHKRFATKYSTIMYHELSSGVLDKLEGMKLSVVEMTRLQDTILDKIVLDKTNITKDQLLQHRVRVRKSEWYITPQEAKKLGIIEGIL